MSQTPATPEPTYAAKLDQILERLERLEELLLSSRIEVAEQGEGLEGDPSEVLLATPPVEAAESRGAAAVFEAARAAVRSPEAMFEQFIDGLGLSFFQGSEFTPFWSRTSSGIRNGVPPRSLWPNIVATLAVLERFRREFGQPVILTSTYRSAGYNQAVGGEPNSWHTQFRAIDFTCPRGRPAEWAQRLKSYRGDTFRNLATGANFIFHGGIGIYPSKNFVHVDTRGYDANWTG